MKYATYILPAALVFIFSCGQADHKPVSSDNSTPAATETKPTEAAKESDNKPAESNGNWKIDAGNSSIGFRVKNFGKDVPGSIGGLSGSINFDKDKPENAKFDASVQVKTINTENKKRDDDLMADKYFNESAHPLIHFKSTKVEKKGDGYVASGDLTIKGVTHPLAMPFNYEEKNNAAVFSSSFTINRHDYNIGGKGPIKGDDIHVKLKVQANKN